MNNKILIGEFETQPIEGLMFLQEDKIGKFMKYEVWVYTDDPGSNPHFHVKTKTDKNFDCCIRIDVCEYFPHGSKRSTLNSKERKALVKFLDSVDKKSGSTNWTRIIDYWNNNDSIVLVDKDLERIDYTQLKEDNNETR